MEKFISEEEVPTMVSGTGQKIESLSNEERMALLDYQSSGGNINKYLSKKSKNEVNNVPEYLLKKFEREVEVMDALFFRAEGIKTAVVVYRGLSVGSSELNKFNSPCYVGTTLAPDVTVDEMVKKTNRKVLQIISLQPGQKAIYLPTYMPYDAFGERELLLPRNTNFRILKREMINGVLVETIVVVV